MHVRHKEKLIEVKGDFVMVGDNRGKYHKLVRVYDNTKTQVKIYQTPLSEKEAQEEILKLAKQITEATKKELPIIEI